MFLVFIAGFVLGVLTVKIYYKVKDTAAIYTTPEQKELPEVMEDLFNEAEAWRRNEIARALMHNPSAERLANDSIKREYLEWQERVRKEKLLQTLPESLRGNR